MTLIRVVAKMDKGGKIRIPVNIRPAHSLVIRKQNSMKRQ